MSVRACAHMCVCVYVCVWRAPLVSTCPLHGMGRPPASALGSLGQPWAAGQASCPRHTCISPRPQRPPPSPSAHSSLPGGSNSCGRAGRQAGARARHQLQRSTLPAALASHPHRHWALALHPNLPTDPPKRPELAPPQPPPGPLTLSLRPCNPATLLATLFTASHCEVQQRGRAGRARGEGRQLRSLRQAHGAVQAGGTRAQSACLDSVKQVPPAPLQPLVAAPGKEGGMCADEGQGPGAGADRGVSDGAGQGASSTTSAGVHRPVGLRQGACRLSLVACPASRPLGPPLSLTCGCPSPASGR